MIKKIVVSIVTISIILTGCSKNDILTSISKEIGVDISSEKILEEKDDHGGFCGDGIKIVKIKIENKQFISELESSSEWKPQISKAIQGFLYGLEEGDCEYRPFISDEDDTPLIPTFSHAYYFIKNRNSDSRDLKGTELLEFPSANVTIAVYDTETSVLYYCEYDS